MPSTKCPPPSAEVRPPSRCTSRSGSNPKTPPGATSMSSRCAVACLPQPLGPLRQEDATVPEAFGGLVIHVGLDVDPTQPPSTWSGTCPGLGPHVAFLVGAFCMKTTLPACTVPKTFWPVMFPWARSTGERSCCCSLARSRSTMRATSSSSRPQVLRGPQARLPVRLPTTARRELSTSGARLPLLRPDGDASPACSSRSCIRPPYWSYRSCPCWLKTRC